MNYVIQLSPGRYYRIRGYIGVATTLAQASRFSREDAFSMADQVCGEVVALEHP